MFCMSLQYSCCGQLGAHDYILMGRAIPNNCYKAFQRHGDYLFTEGCLQAVQAHATDNVAVGLIIKWLLLLVEVSSTAALATFFPGIGWPRAGHINRLQI